MINYVSRGELGWPLSAAPDQDEPVEGLKIHYEGTPVPVVNHSKCAGRWTAIRNSHLANTKEGYSDVAYNWAVCDHGTIFEGRGWGKRTGANGNQILNRPMNSILWMGGTSGVVTPSDAAIESIKELIQYLRSKGAGKAIKGHRDGYATDCPGDAMYSLVKSGKLEPAPAAPKPQPVYAPFPGRAFFKVGAKSPVFTAVGKALVKAGFKGYKVGPSPEWGPADERGIKWFQEKQGWTGSDADGKPGPETWRRLKVPKP